MSDNEAAPIAWMATDGRFLVPNSAYGYPYAVMNEYGEIVQGLPSLPDNAVPPVPATDAAPQLPALDTPEALRYAADVVAKHFPGIFRSGDRSVVSMIRDRANDLEADRIEAARADAEREARIEKLAERGYSGNMRMLDLKPRWASESPDMRAHWTGWAEWMDDGALDDLGYRLDPTQAKATS